MKVLFIYPENYYSYPLQIGILSSYIKNKGHQSKLLSLLIKKEINNKNYEAIEKIIIEFKPDYVAFSVYEMAFPYVKKISTFIKKNWPEILIILGGYYPTLAPEEVISFPYVDIICLGEGEEALAELLSDKKINYGIKNLWFKTEKGIIRNPIRRLIEDLDNIPFPDREMLDYQEHLNFEKRGERNIKVMATRGCPYDCTYCSNNYIRSIYPNRSKYLRFRSPKNVIEELKYLKSNFVFEKVGFHDDNLTLNINWLRKFMELYLREINIPFYCAARVESCKDEVLDILVNAGCYLLLIGVETGDEEYRSNLMKRNMTNKLIIEVFKRAKQKGLRTWSFTMVGLPFETRKMLFRTIWLNLKCNPDFVMASIFYPLKGTELGDVCYKNNWVNLEKKEKVSSYAWESIINHNNLKQYEIKLAKYVNSLTAFRSLFFWKIFLERFKNVLLNKGSA